MLIEDVNELCRLFGEGEFEVEDLGDVGAWCFDAKGTLKDGSFYQFRVSEGLFMAMSLFSNGSGLFQRLLAIVPDWCREHEITTIDANMTPANRERFLTKIPESLIIELAPNPEQHIEIRDNALDN